MIELRNVVRVYHNYNDEKVTALKGINLKLADTGLVCVAGPSGGGKTTLLNILSGVDIPTSGEMFINGVSTEKFDAQGYDGYRNNFVGVIHQDLHLLDHLTLGQNVALAMEIKGIAPNADEISTLFKKLGIEGLENRYPNQCSIGQCQRAAIARTLIKKPRIIIADEPTSSIDPDTRIEVFGLLKELSKDTLIVTSTHTREMIERFADRILMIEQGNIIGDVMTGGDNTNIAVLDQGKVVAVEPGAILTARDIDKVNDAIRKNNKRGVYLCLETDIAKVNPAAAKEAQAALKNKQKVKEKDKQQKMQQLQAEESGVFQFEKTKLPFKSAWRLSVVNFTSNKLRSIFTIVLSFLAIMFFALTSNIGGVNLNYMIINTFANGNEKYITFGTNSQLFNESNAFGDLEHGWINTTKSGLVYDIGQTPETALPSPQYSGQILGVRKVVIDDASGRTPQDPNKFGMRLAWYIDAGGIDRVAGRWPEAQPVDRDRIVISDFVAVQIQTAAYLGAIGLPDPISAIPTFGQLTNLANPDGHNEIMIDGKTYYIVGIYETNFREFFMLDPDIDITIDGVEVFDVFPNNPKPPTFNPRQLRLFPNLSKQQRSHAEHFLQNEYVTGFVAADFVTDVVNNSDNSFVHEGPVDDKDYFITGHHFNAPNGPVYQSRIEFQTSNPGTTGAVIGNEIRVSQSFLDDILNGSSAWNFRASKRVQSHSILPDWTGDSLANVFQGTTYTFHFLRSFEFEVVGEVLPDAGYAVLLSQTYYRELRRAIYMPTTSFIMSGDHSAAALRDVFNAMNTSGDVTPSYADSEAIARYAGNFDAMSPVMTTAAVAFGVFVAVMMYNYIFQSIRSKRKSIAVIRSMGARTLDVFRIFALEALLIAGLICFGAFISAGIAGAIGNAIVHFHAGLRLFVFGLNPLFMFAVVFATALVIFASYMIPMFAYSNHRLNKGLVRNMNVKSDN